MTAANAVREPIVAKAEERKGLADVVRTLGRGKRGRARLVGPDGHQTLLPESIYRVILAAARQLGEGNGVSILPVLADLTTTQAAEFLAVSRPFVVKLVDAGELPSHKVGTHRRIYLRDLVAFKQRRDQKGREALARLVADAQELDIYEK
jgi:excisionase family DNA binding protein